MRYHNFILTLWQDGDPLPNAPPRWRYSLENPHTGTRHGFNNSDELLAFISQWTDRSPPARLPFEKAGESGLSTDVQTIK